MSTVKSLRMDLLILMATIAPLAGAQVAVDISSQGVKINSGTSVNVNSGAVSSDVQMDGIAVINGEVFIDGEKVPKGKTSYTAKKTGKSYLIEWGKDGNVSVSEK